MREPKPARGSPRPARGPPADRPRTALFFRVPLCALALSDTVFVSVPLSVARAIMRAGNLGHPFVTPEIATKSVPTMRASNLSKLVASAEIATNSVTTMRASNLRQRDSSAEIATTVGPIRLPLCALPLSDSAKIATNSDRPRTASDRPRTARGPIAPPHW